MPRYSVTVEFDTNTTDINVVETGLQIDLETVGYDNVVVDKIEVIEG